MPRLQAYFYKFPAGRERVVLRSVTLVSVVAACQAFARAERDYPALLHVGFAGIDEHAVETMLRRRVGVYLTESARWALPRGFFPAAHPIGVCASARFGDTVIYQISDNDDLGHTAMRQPSVARWIEDLEASAPEVFASLMGIGVRSDESYGALRAHVPKPLRVVADRARFLVSFPTIDDERPLELLRLVPDWTHDVLVHDLLSPRSANALRNSAIVSVGDVVALSPSELMHVKKFGRASALEVAKALHALVFAGARDDSPPVSPARGAAHFRTQQSAPRTLAERLDAAYAQLAPRDAMVARRTLGDGDAPQTLQAIAASIGVTRERVRQLRDRAYEVFQSRLNLGTETMARVGAILERRTEPLYLDDLAMEDDWFGGYEDRLPLLGRIVEAFSSTALRVWPLGERLVVTRIDEARWRALHSAVRSLLERAVRARFSAAEMHSVGRALAIEFGAGEMAGEIQRYIDRIAHYAVGPDGIPRLASVGEGIRSEITVVITESERPLHVREIAERLAARGVAVGSIARLRSAVVEAGGQLFGRSVYGLERHLPFTATDADLLRGELESIVTVGARNRQWHSDELVKAVTHRRPELSDGLDSYAVGVILSRSALVRDLGRMVWTATAHGAASRERLTVAALCEDALRSAGRPLSSTELRKRIQTVRGVKTAFVVTPSERVVHVAKGLWGLADRDEEIPEDQRQALLDALHRSLARRGYGLHVSELTSAIGAEARRGRDPMNGLVILRLATSDNRFRIGRGQIIGLAGWKDLGRLSGAQAMRRIVQEWSGTLTFEQLSGRMYALTNRSMSARTIASRAVTAGLVYDARGSVWVRAGLVVNVPLVSAPVRHGDLEHARHRRP